MVVIHLDRHPLTRMRRHADHARRDASPRREERMPNARLFPLIRIRRAKSRASS